MTKKDFQLIAATLANPTFAVFPLSTKERNFRDALAVDFANMLATTNPRFKRELFIQAATGQVSVTARKAKLRGDLVETYSGGPLAMQFRIGAIDCDNAAFEDDYAAEVARILHHVARRLEAGDTDGKLLDINGNTVGQFGFSTLVRRRTP